MNILQFIGRESNIFTEDILLANKSINEIVKNSSFLVIGGAGSVGQAVTNEIFKRKPLKLHVVDLNENNLVELVRDLRSKYGYIKGEFETYTIDVGSLQFERFINFDGKYDYILNLSALKHVRSEKDPFTLMRMIDVNILNTKKTLDLTYHENLRKYFAVSTDKATNPANMMGASKRIMEMLLISRSNKINISTARFANVAFSDGSLLHGFNQRINKSQPIVAPNDVKRYFITPEESGILCLMSCLLGENRDIFFPKLNLKLISFSEVAIKYLNQLGYEPYFCESEKEARDYNINIHKQRKWPCFFSSSDTSGEKFYEEFFSKEDILDLHKFKDIGVIKNNLDFDIEKLEFFFSEIEKIKKKKEWSKKSMVELFKNTLPNFNHLERGKNLESKM